MEPREIETAKYLSTVLVLEDEAIIALDLEDMLIELGSSQVVCFDTCAGATQWLSDGSPTFAVLDPRVKDGYCGEVARILSGNGIPFVVYSGDPTGAGIEDVSFEQGTWLLKPTTPADLSNAVTQAIQQTSL